MGYQNNCGNCPGLYSTNPFDATFENLNFKKKYLSKVNLHVLAGSEGQLEQAKRSALFVMKPIHKILIPVNATVFKPTTKSELRINLGIPIDKKVIFFGAVGLTERRKGMSYLIESLHILDNIIQNNEPDLKNKILLLVAGEAFDGIKDKLPFEFHYMGFLKNNEELASAYQASDIFLCPSIEDSGPMMINQSIMCGVPVVSFELGVSLDLVLTGETGYRAKLRDSNDMAEGIFYFLRLADDDYLRVSKNCRDLAMKLYSPEVQILALEKLMNN
jgi:glycosyltransferase involved in cell wall biosynthesis